MHPTLSRRAFATRTSLASLGGALMGPRLWSQESGDRPKPPADHGIEVLNPQARVPMSMIIDDSTCLVNLAHFAIPQFAEVFPDRYQQPWRDLPREIPDAFVRRFGEWCHEHGVKGKYSIVPYPACVGWVDRDLPGWSKQSLKDSLNLVRDLMMPDWDIHPEMVSHTWVINTKTGRPFETRNEHFMENWRWTDGKSVDELANYLSYALQILKNAGLDCEGITTPGGFGNRVLPELSQATLESCREVFRTEIPHYFRHLFTGDESVKPRVEYASGLNGPDPQCVVSIIGCTGDWFGGWDGLTPGSVDKFISQDGKSGRLPEVIARGEPAIMVCHWPGIYYNGEELGFRIFKEAVRRTHAHHDNLIWMKLSEISRYWAAKELTTLTSTRNGIHLQAPFATHRYTVKFRAGPATRVTQVHAGERTELKEVAGLLNLKDGTWTRQEQHIVACFSLPKGSSALEIG